MSALWQAASKGNLQNVKDLVSVDEDVNFNNAFFRYTPLHIAIKNGHTSVASYLISLPGIDLEVKNDNGGTAFHHACYYHAQLDIVKKLIKKSADVNVLNVNGNTGLHMAVHSGATTVVEYLLSLPQVEREIKNINGNTELIRACKYKREDILRMLVRDGADINAANVDGDTGLHFAVSNSDIQILKYLLRNNVQISRNKKGQSAKDLAKGKTEILSVLQEYEKININDRNTGIDEQHLQQFIQCLQQDIQGMKDTSRHSTGGGKIMDLERRVCKMEDELKIALEKMDIQGIQEASNAAGPSEPGNKMGTKILDSDLTDRKLLQIAKELGSDWKILGGLLGIAHVHMQRLMLDHPHESLYCAWVMLMDWRNGHPGDGKARIADLSTALQEHGKMNIVQMLGTE